LISCFDPQDEIEIEKKLGAGAFGIVYGGSYNDTEVAIKQTNLNVGQNSLDEFKREAVLLLSIKPHPCVVQVLGISTSESNVYMVMEYVWYMLLLCDKLTNWWKCRFCEEGSLDVVMQSRKLSSDEKEKILDSAASGLGHLHRCGVVHRDIAARNILIAAGLKAKIADFGMSRMVDKFELKGTTAASVGPIKYMAPESLTRNKEYSAASDCWTFGVLCIEVWTGKPPHAHLDMLEAAVEIRDKGLHPEIPADMPQWLQDLVSKCFAFAAKDRITMKDILKVFRHHRVNRAESMRGKAGTVSSGSFKDSADQ
jgi:serine/threonine protein kinase